MLRIRLLRCYLLIKKENYLLEINKIHCGDCLDLLKDIDDDSVDAIVTDPPYELGFMGKAWDGTGIAYNVVMWKECLRVLKPGGYLLSFGGSRTHHRIMVAIEDVGFSIRDTICWAFGSGFPKSHNIGKAVDKLQGNEREKFIKTDGKATNSGSGCYQMNDGKDTSMKRVYEDTKGTSEWEGWGTALKPAVEYICMARKPLSEKTVALNVLKHGTGGINIDECRVRTDDNLNGGAYSGGQRLEGDWKDKSGFKNDKLTGDYEQPQGRFPANLILSWKEDEYVLKSNISKDQKGNALRWLYENA